MVNFENLESYHIPVFQIYKRAAHLLTLYWSDSDSEGMENSDSNMSFGSPQALTNIVI